LVLEGILVDLHVDAVESLVLILFHVDVVDLVHVIIGYSSLLKLGLLTLHV
jgi:hypothetical protein